MRYLLVAIILVAYAKLPGQVQRTNQWYFGYDVGLDFGAGNPSPIASRMRVLEGSSSFSDGCGFLCYSDGDTIWNRNHQPMLNGYDLAGKCRWYPGSCTQPCLFVKQPGDDSLLYIFTTDCIEDSLKDGFRYSIVNMKLDGGLGAVTVKNKPLFAPGTEKMAAYHHQNGCDIWVVSHEFGTNAFRAYLLAAGGLVETPVTSTTGQAHYYVPNYGLGTGQYEIARGYLKFSPDGSTLATVAMPDDIGPPTGWYYGLYPELFDFDRSTGKIASKTVLTDMDSVPYYGVAFSPDGTKLYLSSAWYSDSVGGYIHQFDLKSPDVFSSRTLVFQDTFPEPAGMQLGADGKIYVSGIYTRNGAFIGIINNPNEKGTNCGFTANGIPLPTGTGIGYGMPTFVESYRSPPRHSLGFSFQPVNASRTYAFTPNAPCAATLRWDFGDGNTSVERNPVHSYEDDTTTIHTVSLVASYPDEAPCASPTLDTARIRVVRGDTLTPEFFLPTLFTPNGDGVNDLFPYRILQSYRLLIYDRWGVEMVSYPLGTHRWDGTHNGKPAPEGVYFYWISLLKDDNTWFDRAGSVTLLR